MPAQRRLKNLDDERLLVWKVQPFNDLYTAFQSVRDAAVPQRPLGLITGPAGTGKTYTANVFAKNEQGVVIVTTPPRDILTPRNLLDAIAVELDLEPGGFRTKGDLFDAIVDRLIEIKPFIIIDEADRLYPSNADLLREIAELSRQPLCFLGCPKVEATLARVEATHHRIGLRHSVRPVEAEDLAVALVGSYAGSDRTRRLDDVAVQAIYDCTHGNLRHVQAILRLLYGAVDKTKNAPAEPTPQVIRALNRRFLKAA